MTAFKDLCGSCVVGDHGHHRSGTIHGECMMTGCKCQYNRPLRTERVPAVDVNDLRATLHFIESHHTGDAVDCVTCASKADAIVTLMQLRRPTRAEGRLSFFVNGAPLVPEHKDWLIEALQGAAPNSPWHDLLDIAVALEANGMDETSLKWTWSLITMMGEPDLDDQPLKGAAKPRVHRAWHNLHPKTECRYAGSRPWADLA